MSGLNEALQIAVSGLEACEARLRTTAQNLANISTRAGRREFLIVMDRGYREFISPGTGTSQAGTINPTGYQVGTGVQVVGNYQSFEMGERIQTQEKFDVFIEGDGFFMVTMPDGTTAYSRVGNLQRDNQGRLVMPGTGYPISPNITIPPEAEDVSINSIGEVYVYANGQDQLIGQIQLATFINPSGLRYLGHGLYGESGASGTPDIGNPQTGKRGAIVQYAYEGSNIQAVDEIVNLVQVEKDNNAITKVLKTGEEMWKAVNQIGV